MASKEPLILLGSRHEMSFFTDTAEQLGIEVLGILDQYYHGNTDTVDGVPVIGSELDLIDNPKLYKDARFMLANTWDGNTRFGNLTHDGYHLRQQRLELINKLRLPLHTLIDPRAIVGKSVEVGPGSYIAPMVNIRSKTRIGSNVFIHDNAMLAHDIDIGDGTVLAPDCTILGGVKIGTNVYVGSRACVLNGHSTKQPFVSIGDNSKIHAGALVQKDLPANSIATFNGRVMKRPDIK
jgi:UDP-3-O-[3-hydroxymyristoyl] glucosamine N-acyltransferase